MRLKYWVGIAAAPGWIAMTGCGIAPKNFQKLNDPAPIVRARSVSLAEGLPEGQVVPALIDRLEDKDAVVRLAAYEELRQGTGKTFGFIPWASEADRASAVNRWRAWWKEQRKDSPASSDRTPRGS